MQLDIVRNRISGSAFFKLATTAYFLGAIAIFLPFFGLFSLLALLGAPMTVNGEVVEQGGRVLFPLMVIVIVPIFFAMQAVIVGLFATLGLWLYQKRRPITITVLTPEAPTS